MKSAAKKESFLLAMIVIALSLALSFCAAATASNSSIEGPKTRAELKTDLAQNAPGQSLFHTIKHVVKDNRFQRTALGSPLALKTGVNVKHIFHGEINRRGRAVGFHHAGSIGHQGRARISSIVDPANAQGVYRARVEVFNSATGQWVTKGSPSTFFPNAWSRTKVLDEIRGAFGNQTLTRGNYFEGLSPSGVRIGGYLDNAGNINTAFPFF